MPKISVRLSDDDSETLDRLVVAVRAFYERQPAPFNQFAREVTRSSALRDLLSAWKHGMPDQFSRDITVPTVE